MKNLVLKDMTLLGVYNIILLAVPLALGVISVQPEKDFHAILLYLLAILVPVYLLVIRLSINDITSNASSLLISLPVKKFDIVKSRYVSILIYILLISLIVFISSNSSIVLLGSRNRSVFNFTSMLFTTSSILLFLSVNIPFQYYDARKTQIFNSLFYAFIILFPNLLGKLNINLSNNIMLKKILTLEIKIIAPVLLTISIIVYIASSFISKNIFERKEF